MEKIFGGLAVGKKSDANVFVASITVENNDINNGSFKSPEILKSISKDLYPVDLSGKLLDKIKVFDCGNFGFNDFNKIIAQLQFNFLDEQGFHIVFGGDRSTSIPSERAFYCKCLKENKEPILIHISHQADFSNRYKKSIYSEHCRNIRAIEYGFKEENISIIGTREYEPEELETLKKFKNITLINSLDIRENGVQKSLEFLISKYKSKNNLVYISYDLGVNDPSFACGVNKLSSFGLTDYETRNLLVGLVSNLNVDVLEVVGINPKKDVNNQTSTLAIKTLYEVLSVINGKK